MSKLLIKPSEAAELLGVGRSKVYQMLAAGELPSLRVGALVRIPSDALRRWVEERTKHRSPESRKPDDGCERRRS
jgi:excisionase family DNA binding protein